MAKNKNTDTALQALQLDLEFRNRELAVRAAQAAAELAFQQKRTQLIEAGQIQQQADQFAKQYALNIAQFTYEQDLAQRRFGLSTQGQAFQQAIAQRQQQFEESWRNAEQSGFINGAPTLGREQFWETQRQFDTNLAQRQYEFGVNTVMNAPRGPADYAAYLNRLRGLNTSGMLPGVLPQLFGGGQIAQGSSGGQATPDVLSNSELARVMTSGQPNIPAPYRGEPAGPLLPGTFSGPAPYLDPGPVPLPALPNPAPLPLPNVTFPAPTPVPVPPPTTPPPTETPGVGTGQNRQPMPKREWWPSGSGGDKDFNKALNKWNQGKDYNPPPGGIPATPAPTPTAASTPTTAAPPAAAATPATQLAAARAAMPAVTAAGAQTGAPWPAGGTVTVPQQPAQPLRPGTGYGAALPYLGILNQPEGPGGGPDWLPAAPESGGASGIEPVPGYSGGYTGPSVEPSGYIDNLLMGLRGEPLGNVTNGVPRAVQVNGQWVIPAASAQQVPNHAQPGQGLVWNLSEGNVPPLPSGADPYSYYNHLLGGWLQPYYGTDPQTGDHGLMGWVVPNYDPATAPRYYDPRTRQASQTPIEGWSPQQWADYAAQRQAQQQAQQPNNDSLKAPDTSLAGLAGQVPPATAIPPASPMGAARLAQPSVGAPILTAAPGGAPTGSPSGVASWVPPAPAGAPPRPEGMDPNAYYSEQYGGWLAPYYRNGQLMGWTVPNYQYSGPQAPLGYEGGGIGPAVLDANYVANQAALQGSGLYGPGSGFAVPNWQGLADNFTTNPDPRAGISFPEARPIWPDTGTDLALDANWAQLPQIGSPGAMGEGDPARAYGPGWAPGGVDWYRWQVINAARNDPSFRAEQMAMREQLGLRASQQPSVGTLNYGAGPRPDPQPVTPQEAQYNAWLFQRLGITDPAAWGTYVARTVFGNPDNPNPPEVVAASLQNWLAAAPANYRPAIQLAVQSAQSGGLWNPYGLRAAGQSASGTGAPSTPAQQQVGIEPWLQGQAPARQDASAAQGPYGGIYGAQPSPAAPSTFSDWISQWLGGQQAGARAAQPSSMADFWSSLGLPDSSGVDPYANNPYRAQAATTPQQAASAAQQAQAANYAATPYLDTARALAQAGSAPAAATGSSGAPSGGGIPYGTGNRPFTGDLAAVQRMFGRAFDPNNPAPANLPYGNQVSLQNWRHLTPTEQQYAAGAVAEFAGQPQEDFLQQLAMAAPGFNRSRQARMPY